MDIWPIEGNPDKVISNEGVLLSDRWGRPAEGFMIGGMAPTSWFNELVIEGWALTSEDEDLSGIAMFPFVGRDGGMRVTLLNGISQLGKGPEEGESGDWVIRYAPDDIRIVNEKFFNYQFVIVDRRDT